MTAGGFSTARLGRLREVMHGYVERNNVAGAVTAICRHDEVRIDTFGRRDFDSGEPMQHDTIFRIASMTKPIAAVAAMMLVEETKLRLDDPVDRWLPELADRRVVRTLESPLDDTVPANRPITLRDLLTLRFGLGVMFATPEQYPIQHALTGAGLDPGPLSPAMSPEEWMRRLGSLPLAHQPGECWMYHTGFDVLNVLLARVTGMNLDDFLRERVFAPLGMRDTGFRVPEDQFARLAGCYSANQGSGVLTPFDAGREGAPARPPVFPSELVSTAADFLAFARMLLQYGKHGADRLLARPTVELMTTDQITLEQKAVSPFSPGFWESTGWGFGVGIATRRDDIAAVPGQYGWNGGFGTHFFVDPREDMVGILMIQRLLDSVVLNMIADFRTLAYQAIDD